MRRNWVTGRNCDSPFFLSAAVRRIDAWEEEREGKTDEEHFRVVICERMGRLHTTNSGG